nr:hypothetical protein Itr_chr01CG06010 [Ipomoea trifida]
MPPPCSSTHALATVERSMADARGGRRSAAGALLCHCREEPRREGRGKMPSTSFTAAVTLYRRNHSNAVRCFLLLNVNPWSSSPATAK